MSAYGTTEKRRRDENVTICHNLLATDPHQCVRKLVQVVHWEKWGTSGNSSHWQMHWNKQRVITLKTHFCDWTCQTNVWRLAVCFRKGQSGWELKLGTETEEQKGTKSINETDIHTPPHHHHHHLSSSVAVINAVYPGLWRPPDNGLVICFCSLLNHLRATIIVLSVWTGEISVRCLV